jgi:hypothetical protein
MHGRALQEGVSGVSRELHAILNRVCLELKPTANRDEEDELRRQRVYLGRCFLQLLITALANNAFPVLVNLGRCSVRQNAFTAHFSQRNNTDTIFFLIVDALLKRKTNFLARSNPWSYRVTNR